MGYESLDEIKAGIIDLVEKAQHESFVYMQCDSKGENRLIGNLSDDAALKFMKHLAIERPKAYKEFLIKKRHLK